MIARMGLPWLLLMGLALCWRHFAQWSLDPLSSQILYPIVLVFALWSVEALFPFNRENRLHKRYLSTDAFFITLGYVVTPKMWSFLLSLFFLVLPRSKGPVAQLPFAAEVVIGFLILEFGKYWAHRAQHTWPFLWRFHAVHHAAPGIWTTNANVSHPVDAIVRHYLPSLPVIYLGFSRPAFALITGLSFLGGTLSHLNLGLVNLPILNKLFSTQQVHRWHHSRRPEESDANYGVTLMLWDHLFGTYSVPADRPGPAEYGIDDASYVPSSPLRLTIRPFFSRRWFQGPKSSDSSR